MILEFVTAFAIVFVPNVQIFIALRGLCAAFGNGCMQTTYIMGEEALKLKLNTKWICINTYYLLPIITQILFYKSEEMMHY